MDNARLVVGILTLIMTLLTLLPLSRNQRWWVRIWDFPRLQMAVLSLVFLLLELCFLPGGGQFSWLIVLLALGCTIYQSWWIFPYTGLSKVQVKKTPASQHPRIKILNCNVLMTNRKSEKLLEILAQNRPDVIVLLETNLWWEQQMAPLQASHPYTLKCPLENLYGMHVYSRFPSLRQKFSIWWRRGSLRCIFASSLRAGAGGSALPASDAA